MLTVWAWVLVVPVAEQSVTMLRRVLRLALAILAFFGHGR
jgi:hypothetical protein